MKVLLLLAASLSRADEFDEEQTTLLQSLIHKEEDFSSHTVDCRSGRCKPHEPPEPPTTTSNQPRRRHKPPTTTTPTTTTPTTTMPTTTMPTTTMPTTTTPTTTTPTTTTPTTTTPTTTTPTTKAPTTTTPTTTTPTTTTPTTTTPTMTSKPHEPPTATNCPLPKDAKVCNIWGDPFVTHAFDGGYHKNIDRDAVHRDIKNEKDNYLAYDDSAKGFEFMESGVFRVASQGSDFEAQTFMCSGPEIPPDVSSWGPGWDATVYPTSSINGVAVKMGNDTVQVLRNPQTRGKYKGDIHGKHFWSHITAVPRDQLQEFYVNGKKTSWHAIGTDGSLEGATGVDVPETARGDFIGNSRNYISQFHSPKPSEADILTTPVCVGSADGKFLFEIGTPVTNSAQFEQQVTIFATSPDTSGVCGDTAVRNEMNWLGMTATEKLKTSLTVTPNDILFTAKQLADLCHVCHMPMHQVGFVSICSGSHLDKFQEGHYDFCNYKEYSHAKATESCKNYKGQWNAVCIVEQCMSHGKAAKLIDMETELEDYISAK